MPSDSSHGPAALPPPPVRNFLDLVAFQWMRLWSAPSGNARYLILSGGLWAFFQAATDPYKALFYNRIGLSTSMIGSLVACDLVVRSTGMLLSGWTQRRFGAKRMLVLADSVSWVLPYLILSLSTRPWHIVVAILLTSLNAFASTPYNCLMAEGMPSERRTRAYAFLYLWNILPSLVVPLCAGLLVENLSFLPLLRGLFFAQAVSMAVGISLRARHLKDLAARTIPRAPEFLHELRQILSRRGFPAAWATLVFLGIWQQVWGNFAAIFLVRRLGVPDRIPAWMAEAGALGFVAGSLLLLSRLKESTALLVAPIGLALHGGVVLSFLLHPSAGRLLVLALTTGICSSFYTAASSSALTSALPAHLRDHGFALSFVGIHLCCALAMPWVGRCLQGDLDLFPWIAGSALVLGAFGLGIARVRLVRS